MIDNEIATSVDEVASHLHRIVDQQRTDGSIPQDTDVVLSIRHDRGERYFYYYLASQSEQQVFWLGKVVPWYITDGQVQICSDAHIREWPLSCLTRADMVLV